MSSGMRPSFKSVLKRQLGVLGAWLRKIFRPKSEPIKPKLGGTQGGATPRSARLNQPPRVSWWRLSLITCISGWAYSTLNARLAPPLTDPVASALATLLVGALWVGAVLWTTIPPLCYHWGRYKTAYAEWRVDATPSQRAQARHPFITAKWPAYIAGIALMLSFPLAGYPFCEPIFSAASKLFHAGIVGTLFSIALHMLCHVALKAVRDPQDFGLRPRAARCVLLGAIASFALLGVFIHAGTAVSTIYLITAARAEFGWQAILSLNAETTTLQVPFLGVWNWAFLLNGFGPFADKTFEDWNQFYNSWLKYVGIQGGLGTAYYRPSETLLPSIGFVLYNLVLGIAWGQLANAAFSQFLRLFWRGLLSGLVLIGIFLLQKLSAEVNVSMGPDEFEAIRLESEYFDRLAAAAGGLPKEVLEELELLHRNIRQILYVPYVVSFLWGSYALLLSWLSPAPNVSFLWLYQVIFWAGLFLALINDMGNFAAERGLPPTPAEGEAPENLRAALAKLYTEFFRPYFVDRLSRMDARAAPVADRLRARVWVLLEEVQRLGWRLWAGVRWLCRQLWAGVQWLCWQLWAGSRWLCRQLWAGSRWLCRQLWAGIRRRCQQFWAWLRQRRGGGKRCEMRKGGLGWALRWAKAWLLRWWTTSLRPLLCQVGRELRVWWASSPLLNRWRIHYYLLLARNPNLAAACSWLSMKLVDSGLELYGRLVFYLLIYRAFPPREVLQAWKTTQQSFWIAAACRFQAAVCRLTRRWQRRYRQFAKHCSTVWRILWPEPEPTWLDLKLAAGLWRLKLFFRLLRRAWVYFWSGCVVSALLWCIDAAEWGVQFVLTSIWALFRFTLLVAQLCWAALWAVLAIGARLAYPLLWRCPDLYTTWLRLERRRQKALLWRRRYAAPLRCLFLLLAALTWIVGSYFWSWSTYGSGSAGYCRIAIPLAGFSTLALSTLAALVQLRNPQAAAQSGGSPERRWKLFFCLAYPAALILAGGLGLGLLPTNLNRVEPMTYAYEISCMWFHAIFSNAGFFYFLLFILLKARKMGGRDLLSAPQWLIDVLTPAFTNPKTVWWARRLVRIAHWILVLELLTLLWAYGLYTLLDLLKLFIITIPHIMRHCRDKEFWLDYSIVRYRLSPQQRDDAAILKFIAQIYLAYTQVINLCLTLALICTLTAFLIALLDLIWGVFATGHARGATAARWAAVFRYAQYFTAILVVYVMLGVGFSGFILADLFCRPCGEGFWSWEGFSRWPGRKG